MTTLYEGKGELLRQPDISSGTFLSQCHTEIPTIWFWNRSQLIDMKTDTEYDTQGQHKYY